MFVSIFLVWASDENRFDSYAGCKEFGHWYLGLLPGWNHLQKVPLLGESSSKILEQSYLL